MPTHVMILVIVNYQSEWNQVGLVTDLNKEKWTVCNNNQTYTSTIPARMSWKDGRSLCHKLGGGNITEAKSNNQLGHLMTLFNYMNSSCEYIWTLLFDEEEEGVFISSVNDYTYGYTTGYLGMWNAPALRMKVRMTRTMRERNRDSSARRVTRHAEPASVRGELRDTLSLHQCAESYKTYAEPASNKQYGVEVSKKEKWTRGNDSLFIVVAPVCSIPIPMVLCCIYN